MTLASAVQASNPYAQRPRPLIRRLAGRIAGKVIFPVLVRLLEREKIRQFVHHHLSNRLAMEEASFHRRVPQYLEDIRGFEDCSWLFSSNELNHGLARLTIEEAGYLYHLVRNMQQPRVVELGRFKGGTTFLLAAAGAHVLSIDNDALPGQIDFTAALEQALQRFGFLEQVENVLGDALSYPREQDSMDLVIVDLGGAQGVSEAAFSYWWPAVRRGGHLLMRDGKCSPLLEVVEFVSQVDIAALGGSRIPHAPGAFVLFRKDPAAEEPVSNEDAAGTR